MKHILLKDEKISVKLYIIFIYILILASSILISIKSKFLAISFVLISVAFLYIIFFIVNFIFEGPVRFLFKNEIDICIRVEEIFNYAELKKYNTYLTDNKFPNINKLIYKDKLPKKEILSFWKYKLSSKKETSQVTLPFIVLLILALLNAPIKEYILNYIFSAPLKEYDIEYLKWIIQVLSLPYAFVVYHSNIERFNSCIIKIEFLKDIIKHE
ncbi:hypothetical protein [Candidatus Clostridium radicumherbarum]|uniref:DUF2953 domain-containing protein n=1 Tax=Candidatus Clostridium radicumherbarum TaxID=3381662 RepID=A0ABW8TV72_9CLOT